MVWISILYGCLSHNFVTLFSAWSIHTGINLAIPPSLPIHILLVVSLISFSLLQGQVLHQSLYHWYSTLMSGHSSMYDSLRQQSKKKKKNRIFKFAWSKFVFNATVITLLFISAQDMFLKYIQMWLNHSNEARVKCLFHTESY